MQKIFWSVFLFFQAATTYNQSVDSIKFDKNTKLSHGLYTSAQEVLHNDPKYLNCVFTVNAISINGTLHLNYLDSIGNMHEFKDTIYAYVTGGDLYIYYHRRFFPLTIKGAISIFYMETIYYTYGSPTDSELTMYFVDILTGEMGSAKLINLENVFKRDPELYKEFSSLPIQKQRKFYYSYILRFNQRNPVYIKNTGYQ